MAAIARCFVEKPPPFVGNAGGLLHGQSKAAELAGKLVKNRLQSPP
jgi:hypothetical protein